MRSSVVPHTMASETAQKTNWKKNLAGTTASEADMAGNRSQIEKLARTLGTTVPTFFMREKPISRNMKPACMNMTKTAATITQTVSTALATSVTFTGAPLFDWTGGPSTGSVAWTPG